MGIAFWLRWSGRDLRRRLPQVTAIATIIALGAGVYAGLGSTSEWRRQSLHESLARLSAHDLRVTVLAGSLGRDELVGALTTAGAGAVVEAESRLVVRAPVTTPSGSSTAVAAGEIVGVDLTTGPKLDRWHVIAGRDLTASDNDVVLLDAHCASAHNLAPTGVLRIGQRDIAYVGLALSPEYLNLTTTSGEAIRGAATRAVMFAPLPLAQDLASLASGQVNDAVVRVVPGGDVETVAAALRTSLTSMFPTSPVTVTTLEDDPADRSLSDEIDSEQRLFDVFALLILAGAGFAVFNLVKRVVEGQRRDIGIAMSLGVPPHRIAIRPLLLATEITVLGVALGLLAGEAIAWWVLSVIRARLPMPYWVTPFQPAWFIRGAALGLVLPIAASIYPVWRAVRVRPVDALVPPHLKAGRHALPRLLRRVRLPGTTLMQAPFGRIVRAPTRSVLTVLAIALVMAPLLAAFGAADSASHTLDVGEHALEGGDGERLLVDLTDFQPATSSVVAAIAAGSLIERAAPALNLGGYLRADGTELAVSLSLVDLDDDLSAPAGLARLGLHAGGIVISAKAAQDMHVGVGDDVTLRHPRRDGTTFRFVDTVVPVTAVHDSPYRFVAYMDLADAGLMGLEGIVNTVKVQPRSGVPIEDVQREITAIPGVASALSTSSSSTTMRAMLGVISRLFLVLQAVIAVLAFLVAFNTSNIDADERAREHATMFAFGIPVRRVVGIGVEQSLVLGVVGVGLGLGFGAAVLRWMLNTVFPVAVPDLTILQSIAPSSFLVTVAVGVAAAAAAPVLNARRLRMMNIPNTLRFVE